MNKLGAVETVWCWKVETPEMNTRRVIDLSVEVINLIGMTLDGLPEVSHYPNLDNKGGYGIQLYQKLVESFLIISTWPDHGIARFYLASCVPFDPDVVGQFLESTVGKIQASGGCEI